MTTKSSNTLQTKNSSLGENKTFTPLGKQLYQLLFQTKKLLSGKNQEDIVKLLCSLQIQNQGKPKTLDLLNDLQEFITSMNSIELLSAPMQSEQIHQFFYLVHTYNTPDQPFIEIVELNEGKASDNPEIAPLISNFSKF